MWLEYYIKDNSHADLYPEKSHDDTKNQSSEEKKS